jgi:hypothetical protein
MQLSAAISGPGRILDNNSMTDEPSDHDVAAAMILLAQVCHDIIQSAIEVEALLDIDLDDENAIGKAVRAKEMGAPLLWVEIHQFERKRKPNWSKTVQQVQAHYEKRLAVIPDVVAPMNEHFHAVRDVSERSLLRLTPSSDDWTFGTEAASTMCEAVLNFCERILQEIPDSDIVRMERRRDEFRIEKETGVLVDRSNLHRFLEFRKRLAGFDLPVLESIKRQIRRDFGTLVAVPHDLVTEPNAIGYVQTPVDPSAYVPASEVLNRHCPDDLPLTHKQLVSAIEDFTKNKIRWSRPMSKEGTPRMNRLLVHLVDWTNYVQSSMSENADGTPYVSPEDKEQRQAAIRAKK